MTQMLAVAVVLATLLFGLVPIELTAVASAQADEKAVSVSRSAATAAVPATALDLPALERRLRATRAIGMFTKLSLKNQVDDLLDQLQEFHDGQDGGPLSRLRERFDLLMLKVLSLLQDGDPALARDIAASREPLWRRLVDPHTFSTLRARVGALPTPRGRAGA